MGVKTRLLHYAATRKWFMTIAVIMELFSSSLNAFVPFYTAIAIRDGIVAGNFGVLIITLVTMVSLVGFASFFGYIRRYLGMNAAHNAIRRLRNDVYYAFENQTHGFYDRNQAGDLLANVTGDVNSVRMFIGMGFLMTWRAVFTTISSVWLMWILSPYLTLWSLIVFPMALIVNLYFAKRVGPVYRTVRKNFSEVSTVLQENVQGVREVRVFGSRDDEEKKFYDTNQKFLQSNLDQIKLRGGFFPSLRLIIAFGVLFILWQGGSLIISGIVDYALVVAMILYVGRFENPIRLMGMYMFFTKNAEAAGERLFKVIDAPIDIIEPENAMTLDEVKGEIEFNNVNFSYGDGPEILKDVSFSIKSGEKIAIIGLTGSGKSSIIKLIPRFYDVKSGTVKIDGYDVRDLNLYSLRKNIGMVSQNPFLFNTNLQENIAYGNEEAPISEIERVAKVAQIHDFIASLPEKYNTKVGERGVSLSGGQRQRTTIARALLPNPQIIILDDSTSSVDYETEQKIHKAIFQTLKEKTVLIITQRLSILKEMDRILVVHNRRVVEQGTHEHLLKHKEVYSQIYNALEKFQTTGVLTTLPTDITEGVTGSGGKK
ncbi:MAG: ABC transporter ATP-binding protein [Candidatus Ranarchaeia archaeon]|jgi:ATP-binding cassette subfamily B protein